MTFLTVSVSDSWPSTDSRPCICHFGDKNITEYVNVDNFDQFVAMHNLMNNDQFEEARAIAEELGLPERGRHKNFKHRF